MLFYGVVSAQTEKVVEFSLEQEEAEEMIREFFVEQEEAGTPAGTERIDHLSLPYTKGELTGLA